MIPRINDGGEEWPGLTPEIVVYSTFLLVMSQPNEAPELGSPQASARGNQRRIYSETT